MEKNPPQLKQVSEKEAWVGESRVYLEGTILYVTQVGECDEATAKTLCDAAIAMMRLVPGKVNIVVDLNRCGRQGSKARKMWNKMNDNPKVGKVALYGLHPVAKMLASFVISRSNKADLRFFSKETDALAWVQG